MTEKNDIVNRLRVWWDSMTDMGNAERAEAADEIERLRKERDEMVMVTILSMTDEQRRRVFDRFAQYKRENP